jgi:hypothetical protein
MLRLVRCRYLLFNTQHQLPLGSSQYLPLG